MLSSQHTLWFSNKDTNEIQRIQDVLNMVDMMEFYNASTFFTHSNTDADQVGLWAAQIGSWGDFYNNLQKEDFNQSEKLMIMKAAFRCFRHGVEAKSLTQLVAYASHLKLVNGMRWFRLLFNAAVPEAD